MTKHNRTWHKRILVIIIGIAILYGIWFDYLDSLRYITPQSNTLLKIGDMLGGGLFYQLWNVGGHFIPTLFLICYKPKKWELAIVGFLISTVVMDTPLWGVEVLYFHPNQHLYKEGNIQTDNLWDWIKFYYNPIGTYGVWESPGYPPAWLMFWSLPGRVGLAVFLIVYQHSKESRLGWPISLREVFKKNALQIKDLGEKQESEYVKENYSVYFSDKIANLYKPILYPNHHYDKPSGLYYRILENNSGEYCIQYFYYWEKQDCVIPEASHIYDYEPIFVYLTKKGPNPDKIVNGGDGDISCPFHKNEIRLRNVGRDEFSTKKTAYLSKYPQYPFGEDETQEERRIEVCIKHYPLEGHDLEFQNLHPGFAICECSHVFSGSRSLLVGKPFDTHLVKLSDEVLREWYFEHCKSNNEMPFGHDVADPFSEPFIKYRDARVFFNH